MSAGGFDPVIHPPSRLQICALLSPLESAEFQVLRDEVGVSDSALSKHLSALEAAGYVKLIKGAANGRARTWAALTRKGHAAFAAHIAALTRMAAVADAGRPSSEA
jgi:DNA-binding MarR family transcriptional regulator